MVRHCRNTRKLQRRSMRREYFEEVTLIEVNGAASEMGERDANAENDFVAADVVEES